MTNNMSSNNEIIQRAKETLKTAQLGHAMIGSGSPENTIPGIRNVIVFGRAVTNVIQNLRSNNENFDDWYLIWVARMKNDTISKYFYKLRSEILKEGILKTSTSVSVSANIKELMEIVPKPALPVKGFFIGDKNGGSGWDVIMPNGEMEKYYVSIPNVNGIMVDVKLHFANSPDEIKYQDVKTVCGTYIGLLNDLINDAERHFKSPNQSLKGRM